MAIILISGGTGLVGKALSSKLINDGHQVRVLTRVQKPSVTNLTYFVWDVNTGYIDEAAFENIDHLVHLAGEGVADKRWTELRKAEIIDSRVKSFELLERVIIQKNIKLKSFVGASAIGFYGLNSTTQPFVETDACGNDFLSEVCVKWENAYTNAEQYCNNKTIIRIGIVLAKNGGALKKMLPVFKLGLGSPISNGKQSMPWVHIDDLVAIFNEALFNTNYSGIYNAVCTEQINNQQFSKALAATLNKPFFAPNVPAFILKLLLGKMAVIVLGGSKINNQKIINAGFKFKFVTIEQALQSLPIK